jgi:lipooligosaccharide transport system permease protein
MDHALRAYEYWLMSYRRVWRGSVVTSVVNPVLYLSALGIGLGRLVNRGGSGLGVPYLDFVAPGMLAAVCMQIAVFESSWPVHAAIRWTRQYHAMLATPLRVRDIVAGHQLWVVTRVVGVAAIYLAILSGFGAIRSPLALLALPSAVLLGLAFTATVSAYAAYVESDKGLTVLFRFIVTPLFLFSGTFFPLSRLPHGVREIAYATPLWHGVDLMRHLTLGTATIWPSLGHAVYLAAWGAAGLFLAQRAYTRALVK